MEKYYQEVLGQTKQNPSISARNPAVWSVPFLKNKPFNVESNSTPTTTNYGANTSLEANSSRKYSNPFLSFL